MSVQPLIFFQLVFDVCNWEFGARCREPIPCFFWFFSSLLAPFLVPTSSHPLFSPLLFDSDELFA